MVHARLRDGAPLPTKERTFFETRLGQDLGHVRVHTDTTAASQARGVHARAFTLGQAIAFGAGEFRPGTEAGRKLLAHELVHTIQQRTMEQPTVQRARHTGQVDYFDPDNCWLPNETKGPTMNVIGRFIGILDAPETCEGEVKMTMRFEALGGWSVKFWLPSSSLLTFTAAAAGIDSAMLTKGKTEIGDSFFEHTISYPLTATSCTTDFDVLLLMAYRHQSQRINFAEVKFSRIGSWDKGMHRSILADNSPDPVVRVDSCGRLVPTPEGPTLPGPAP